MRGIICSITQNLCFKTLWYLVILSLAHSTAAGTPKPWFWAQFVCSKQFYLSPDGRLFKNTVFKQPPKKRAVRLIDATQ